MTTKGRRPKPTAVKELDGNPGRRPLNAAEPKPPRSSGRVPRGMGEVAATFYRKYAPALAQLGVLTTADEPMFKLLAQHVELAQRAYDELNELVPLFDAEGKPILDADGNQIKARTGLTLESKDGRKKNPLTQIFRDNSLAARQFATEFGMTPAARSKLHAETQGQLSIEDILFGASVAVGTDVVKTDV